MHERRPLRAGQPVTDPGPAEGFAIEAEEDESPFAQLGDWVLLAPIPDRAVRVYGILRAHVNHARGDDEVWPSQEKVAAVLGLSKADEVGKAIKILEGIGAVRKKFRTGKRGRYTVYVVRLHAPAGWTGMRSAAVDLHRPGAVERLLSERVKRLPHRTQAGLAAAAAAETESRSSDEYPPDAGSPIRATPDLGATPDGPGSQPPDQGCKPEEGEPDEGTTHAAQARRGAQTPPPPDPVEALFHTPDGPDPDHDPERAAETRMARRRDKASRTPSALNATAHSPAAHRLVAEYMNGRMVPARTRTQLHVEVTGLLREGVPETVLAQALTECGDRGMPPSALANFAAGIANRRTPAARPTRTEHVVSRLQSLKRPEPAPPLHNHPSTLMIEGRK